MSDTPESPQWHGPVVTRSEDDMLELDWPDSERPQTMVAREVFVRLLDERNSTKRMIRSIYESRGIHVETYISRWHEDFAQPYRWRVRHGNGEVMGSGEGYADARDRDHAVQVLFPGVPTKEVEG